MNDVSSLMPQKFSGEGLTEPPTQTPPPAITRASPLGSGFALNSRALRALDSGFALDTRALRALDSGFALQGSIGDLGLAPPQNDFLDPNLNALSQTFGIPTPP